MSLLGDGASIADVGGKQVGNRWKGQWEENREDSIFETKGEIGMHFHLMIL
jgi:hypothetical protein